MESCIIKSPLGYTKIVGDENGITQVTILNSEEKVTDIIPPELEDCTIQLQEYFDGSRKNLDLKLNPQGTDFQRIIWALLEEILSGRTISYLQFSKQLGDPKAIRAVANAIGKNPIWIIIPCHRIIESDGSLTGYSGGLHRKQWLINLEIEYKQQTLF